MRTWWCQVNVHLCCHKKIFVQIFFFRITAGAPEKDLNHAEKVCDMALDMVEAITDLKDPSTGKAIPFSSLKADGGAHIYSPTQQSYKLNIPRFQVHIFGSVSEFIQVPL